MRTDQDIYNDLGTILLQIAPKESRKVMLIAELSPTDNHCNLSYEYSDTRNQVNRFIPVEKQLDSQFSLLLVELRTYFVDHFKSEVKPFWHGCNMTVDIESTTFNIQFHYD